MSGVVDRDDAVVRCGSAPIRNGSPLYDVHWFMAMVGGDVKGGATVGETDEFSLRSVALTDAMQSMIMLAVTFLNLFIGVMGRALYDLDGSGVDHVFPNIVRDYTSAGLREVVVAGIIAASFSTYDSIGSTLSALLTRDVYARLLVPNRDEKHYLQVGRWLTPLIHGWKPAGELREMDESGWLSESRHQLQDLAPVSAEPGNAVPLILGALISLAGIVLTLVVFW